jgi:hypothetical protein
MAATNKKRPAESTTGPVVKRNATRKNSDQDSIEIEPDETCHITVVLHSRYDVFPASLRAKLQTTYTTMIRSQMEALETNVTPGARYTFSVVSELRVRQTDPASAKTQSICRDNIHSLSLANTALLDFFRKTNKRYLEMPNFVQLKTEDGISNPEFIQLHSVRRNEIDWGFDTNGCLSLYLVFMDKAKLHEYVIFVHRMDIKVEEDD